VNSDDPDVTQSNEDDAVPVAGFRAAGPVYTLKDAVSMPPFRFRDADARTWLDQIKKKTGKTGLFSRQSFR
jgi:hypothetical protein